MRAFLGVVALLLSLSAVGASDEVLVAAQKTASRRMDSRLPAGDFDLRLLLTWTDAGSVVDTVGLNGASRGCFALNIVAGGSLQFRVWDGAAWQTVDGERAIPKGQETPVRVVRRKGEIHLETVGIYVQFMLPIWLSEFMPPPGPPLGFRRAA